MELLDNGPVTSDLMCSYCLHPRSETGPLVASPLATICLPCAENALKLFERQAAERQQAAPEDMEGTPTAWSRLTDQELIGRLPEVAAAGAQVEQHLRSWVTAARDRGISWARIGEALGMTRQSAWERFRSS